MIMPAAPLTAADGDAPGHMMRLHNPGTTAKPNDRPAASTMVAPRSPSGN
jgi:hypothetical protein